MSKTAGGYCFGYASESVKKNFKSFFRTFKTLTEAVDALIALSVNLRYKYEFVESDVKYKLLARPTSLDSPAKLHEALLRWYKCFGSSNYNCMGYLVEELLMTRKQMGIETIHLFYHELKRLDLINVKRGLLAFNLATEFSPLNWTLAPGSVEFWKFLKSVDKRKRCNKRCNKGCHVEELLLIRNCWLLRKFLSKPFLSATEMDLLDQQMKRLENDADNDSSDSSSESSDSTSDTDVSQAANRDEIIRDIRMLREKVDRERRERRKKERLRETLKLKDGEETSIDFEQRCYYYDNYCRCCQ